MTADVGDGASVSELIDVLRQECGDEFVSYARLLELVVVAGLDELLLLADLPGSDLEPREVASAPPPARSRPRRRR